jgi:hypothetical protein
VVWWDGRGPGTACESADQTEIRNLVALAAAGGPRRGGDATASRHSTLDTRHSTLDTRHSTPEGHRSPRPQKAIVALHTRRLSQPSTPEGYPSLPHQKVSTALHTKKPLSRRPRDAGPRPLAPRPACGPSQLPGSPAMPWCSRRRARERPPQRLQPQSAALHGPGATTVLWSTPRARSRADHLRPVDSRRTRSHCGDPCLGACVPAGMEPRARSQSRRLS